MDYRNVIPIATTQSLLGLKHGGHERVLDRTGYMHAPKACKLSSDDSFIYLKVRGKELKYPKPENVVFMGKSEYEEGEIIGTAYNTTSPAYRLNAMISLMRATGSSGTRYYEKDDVIMSDCYAVNSGTIHYELDKKGEVIVKIDEVEYDYNPRCMYYFPDGAKVNKFDRICNGVVNISKVLRGFGSDVSSSYIIFRKQMYSLIDPGYLTIEDGRPVESALGSGSVQEEIIELIFISLCRVDFDEKKGEINNLEFISTNMAIRSRDSFYTVLSWGWAADAVSKSFKGDLKIKKDIMTETILGLLLNDKLDDKKKR